MSSIGAAPGAAVLSTARAEASRINGAKSRGPTSPDGKARSAQNALKHGLRSQKFVVLGDESPQAFAALESALVEELAPKRALQGLLVARIARAAWRLERAERIEGELFERHAGSDRNLGLALIRDGHGTRAFDTLLRYRGSALAELWRALRLLKALQAEAAPRLQELREAAPDMPALAQHQPIEPEARTNPGDIARASPADEPEALGLPDAAAAPGPGADQPAPRAIPPARRAPNEPEARRNPGDSPPAPAARQPDQSGDPDEAARRLAALAPGARPGLAHGA